jgi:hypothetical protein
LDEIGKNSNNAFNDTEWTKTDPQYFRNNLTTAYTKFRASTLANPNPATSLRKVNIITPIYISNLGDYDKSGTLLNSIYQEFDLKISASVTMAAQAQEYSKEINKYSKPIKDSLNTVITSLSPLENAFTSINTNVITPWTDIVSY